ncbi:MAG: hypothetical protein GKR88_13900 [Flavobacteriaceae bacterium]|nr:MAG: hypothetical protein GKR88_13900 [Flavobacteriaceae bacterium]
MSINLKILEIMKKTYLLVTILLLSAYSCRAQMNELTQSEYYGIKINEVTFQEIYDTNADFTQMKALFGNDLSYEFKNDILISKQFWNDDFDINFDSDEGTNYFPTFINIYDSSIIVKVKGIELRLGDDRSKFGSLPFNTNSKSYVFTDQDTRSTSLYFKIDETTDKIIEISFFTL